MTSKTVANSRMIAISKMRHLFFLRLDEVKRGTYNRIKSKRAGRRHINRGFQ